MTPSQPQLFIDPEACVDFILSKVGRNIVLGLPLGLGKPNHLANAFFQKALKDKGIRLNIVTAITPEIPTWSTDLERRLLKPIFERVFGGYPELDYALALRSNRLPDNIDVTEFFFRPGAYMGNRRAQQNYISTNYTHAVRDLMANGLNVAASLIGAETIDGVTRYSYSCNPEVVLDLQDAMKQARSEGRKTAVVGQVNRNLPFMYGGALVDSAVFDAVLDHPSWDFPLYAPPKEPVNTQDYMIGIHVSGLIRDGGTLQIGIGSLGDAIAYGLILRNEQNEAYRRFLTEAGILDKFGEPIERIGGTDPFSTGLYGCTEMLVDSYLHLIERGVIKRKVYDHPGLQRLVNQGEIDETICSDILEKLVGARIVSGRLTADDVAFLTRFGIFQPQWRWEDDMLVDGRRRISADLMDARKREEIASACLGDHLEHGVLVHGGFFLGPRDFYERLRRMPAERRRLIDMTAVTYMNQLYGNEEIKILQRRHSRFVNTGILVTLGGAIVSDGLEDGRVISGVGGQYNFVSQAHALPDARGIIMIRATRNNGGKASSNIVWNYGHTTIPRHLRDIVVTEYGIADLRSKPDKEVAQALIEIADSRFQESLLQQARQAGKIPSGYRIPERFRSNFPERLERDIAPFRNQGLFPAFPFGSDLTDEEYVLAKALKTVKEETQARGIRSFDWRSAVKCLSVPPAARPYLERMELDKPSGIREHLMQRLVVYALQRAGVLCE
ncbi:MAG: acetyl-CoA hydrolase/transferase C-terminal domain-containing protein [Thermodesulfobacteriota bacterium]